MEVPWNGQFHGIFTALGQSSACREKLYFTDWKVRENWNFTAFKKSVNLGSFHGNWGYLFTGFSRGFHGLIFTDSVKNSVKFINTLCKFSRHFHGVFTALYAVVVWDAPCLSRGVAYRFSSFVSSILYYRQARLDIFSVLTG